MMLKVCKISGSKYLIENSATPSDQKEIIEVIAVEIPGVKSTLVNIIMIIIITFESYYRYCNHTFYNNN